MELQNIIYWLKWAAALLGAGLSTLMGGWDMGLKVMVLFVICDYVTGVVAAWKEKELDSNVGLFGIAKKIMIFVPVALGYWLDQYLGADILRNVAIWAYVVNEGLSVAENLGRIGVFVPPAFVEALQQLKEKSANGKVGQ